ncbi:MAG: hypothetical protein CMN10_06570 [Roseobacter sp.]|nr:hypothetical protein [Roseobacter sp.]
MSHTTRNLVMSNSTAVLFNEHDSRLSFQMSIPRGDPDGNGSLGWRFVWGTPNEKDKLAAVSIMESYEYLLSEHITADEACSRLRSLRRAYREQFHINEAA